MPTTFAPACLVLDAGGGCKLEIESSGESGEVLDYALEPAPEGLDRWACTVRRLDGAEGPYRVAQAMSGAWRCSCPDAVYRARKERRFCKHARAVMPLRALMVRLAGEA
jgi:hypothetical protein